MMARLAFMPDRVQKSLLREITSLALKLEAKVKAEKLSGQVLKVRTGNLRDSIHHEVSSTASSVVGRVFSDTSVKYGAIHEFGGVINRVGSKKGPYQVTMPKRPFMHPSFEEMESEIQEGIRDAVKEGLLP